MRRIMLAGSIFLVSAFGFSVVAGADEHDTKKDKEEASSEKKDESTSSKDESTASKDKATTTTTKASGSTTTTKASGDGEAGAAKAVKAKASYTG